MTRAWRKVLISLVLATLLASACSSDPTEVVSAEDPDSQSVGDSAQAISSSDSDEDAMEEEEDDSDAMFDSVGGDSAPILLGEAMDTATLRAEHAQAAAIWFQNGLKNYDYSIRATSAENGIQVAHVEVRAGAVTRSISASEELDEAPSIDELFEMIPEELDREGESIQSVTYDQGLSYPRRIAGLENGDPLILEIYRIHVIDNVDGPCSADGLTYPSPTATNPISTTQGRLLEAVQACDYLELIALADEGENELTTSFGGGDPIEFLREAESNGEDFLGIMAELLSTDPAITDDGMAVWPEAFADPDLEYLDWRVGINAEGEWLFFVRGD